MYSEKIIKYYDDIYHDKDYNMESNFIENNSNLNKLLDIGCGTGTHLVNLYKKGRIFYGIDLSKKMIERANRKFKDNKDVIFKCSDIINFKDSYNFDTIISMFNVVNHILTLDELDKYFKSISLLLSEGGVFIFDCFNGSSVFNSNPKDDTKTVISEMAGGSYLISYKSKFNPMSSRLIMNTNVKVFQFEDLVDEFDYSLKVTIWTPQLFKELLKKYNMKVSKLVSNNDYDKEATLEDYKITFVCVKNGDFNIE